MPHLRRDDEVFVLDLGDTENRLHPDWIADVNTKLDEVEATEGPQALVTTATGNSGRTDWTWNGSPTTPTSWRPTSMTCTGCWHGCSPWPTTSAAASGATRAALYSAYLHLKEEFERRRDQLRDAGAIVDPRGAQIDRLKEQVRHLQQRLSTAEQENAGLTAFRTRAVSQLAAQHDEITRRRLRESTSDRAA